MGTKFWPMKSKISNKTGVAWRLSATEKICMTQRGESPAGYGESCWEMNSKWCGKHNYTTQSAIEPPTSIQKMGSNPCPTFSARFRGSTQLLPARAVFKAGAAQKLAQPPCTYSFPSSEANPKFCLGEGCLSAAKLEIFLHARRVKLSTNRSLRWPVMQ